MGQKRQPELKIADVSKVLGERWRNMSAAQKAKYDAKAAADKKRYEKEMKAYKPPYKPKRPMVAFMFFSIEQRPSVQKKNPSLGIADISKKKKKAKDPNKPKRAMVAFMYFS